MASKFEKVMVAGMVLGAGVVGLKIMDKIPDCLTNGEGFGDCLPKGHAEPAQAEYGDIEVKSEDLVGIASFVTYGEVAMVVGGEESVLDYDDPAWTDFDGMWDATMYWNEGGKRPMELRYNPCIKKSDDYTQGAVPVEATVDPAASVATPTPVERPNGALEYKVDFEDKGPSAGTINAVAINAGILDACFMRIAETQANNGSFTYDPDNQSPVGEREDVTFRTAVRNMVIKYAQSQSCPESVLNLDAVKDDIARMILGDLSAQHPNKANLFADAYNDGKFQVSLEGPEVRRSTYLADFTAYREAEANRERTLPDEDGDTAKWAKPKMGNFEVTQCGELLNDFDVEKVD